MEGQRVFGHAVDLSQVLDGGPQSVDDVHKQQSPLRLWKQLPKRRVGGEAPVPVASP